jgi:hypothetical protein
VTFTDASQITTIGAIARIGTVCDATTLDCNRRHALRFSHSG